MQDIAIDKEKALHYILVVPHFDKDIVIKKATIPSFYHDAGNKIINTLIKETVVPNPYPQGIDMITTHQSMSMFGFARTYQNGDGFYHDDEFLHKINSFFWHRNYPTPFGGACLFCGVNLQGETVAPETSIEDIENDTRNLSRPILSRIANDTYAIKDEYERLFKQEYKWQV